MKSFQGLLAAGLLLCAPAAARAADGQYSGLAEYAEETVYYPAGWKLKPGNFRGPESGIQIYRNYVWFDQARPIGKGNWATITLTRWNCENCMRGAHAGSITDFLKDKDCDVPKCAYEQSKCPVHSSGQVPRWRITNKCALLDRFPKLTGGVCGARLPDKTYKGTVYYYFDGETEGTSFSEKGEHLKETTVIFERDRFIYTADLVAPRKEIKKYLPDLETVVRNLSVKPEKKI